MYGWDGIGVRQNKSVSSDSHRGIIVDRWSIEREEKE